MGTFSWVIIVIVLIQVIAGAIAKTAEKRKAEEKAKSLRSETRKQPPPTIRADTTPASTVRGRKKLDLETLRKQRIDALRKRSASVSPQPPPLDPTASSDVPAFVLSEEAHPSQPSPAKKARAPQPQPQPQQKPQRPQRTPASQRPKKKAPAQKTRTTSSFGESLLGSDKALESAIFSESIRSTQIGTELDRQEFRTANAKALDEIIAEPERIRHGLLLAELLQPPVSMRPQGCGGLD